MVSFSEVLLRIRVRCLIVCCWFSLCLWLRVGRVSVGGSWLRYCSRCLVCF